MTNTISPTSSDSFDAQANKRVARREQTDPISQFAGPIIRDNHFSPPTACELFKARFAKNVQIAKKLKVRLGTEVCEGLTLEGLDRRHHILSLCRACMILLFFLVIPLLFIPFLNNRIDQVESQIDGIQKIYRDNQKILVELQTQATAGESPESKELLALYDEKRKSLDLGGNWERDLHDLQLGTLHRRKEEEKYRAKLQTWAETYQRDLHIKDWKTLSWDRCAAFILAMKAKGAFTEHEVAMEFLIDLLNPRPSQQLNDHESLQSIDRFLKEDRSRSYLAYFIHSCLDGSYAFRKTIEAKVEPSIRLFVEERLRPSFIAKQKILLQQTMLKLNNAAPTEQNEAQKKRIQERIDAYNLNIAPNPFLNCDFAEWRERAAAHMLHNRVIDEYRPLLQSLKHEGYLDGKAYAPTAGLLHRLLGIPSAQLYSALPSL